MANTPPNWERPKSCSGLLWLVKKIKTDGLILFRPNKNPEPGENDGRYSWKKNDDWKQRYSKLYSCRNFSLPKIEDTNRISFMSYDTSPYASLLSRMHATASHQVLGATSAVASENSISSTIITPRSEEYDSNVHLKDDLGRNGTLLLDMVRARHRELVEENQEKTLDLPKEDTDDEEPAMESCVHGLSMRMTDRSVSRSRVSRISTRRDMDIPSILAFTTNVPAPVHLEIPAFQKMKTNSQQEEIPRWSIRRSVCPVCSQKWKDRSSINNVKNSGLKRNSSLDLPSVIAPARLRTSITLGYVPRPALAAVDEEAGMSNGGLKNTSAAWQLTRARRFRIPKPIQLPPEAIVPPSTTAPLSRKDLDQRVSRFLRDETTPMNPDQTTGGTS